MNRFDIFVDRLLGFLFLPTVIVFDATETSGPLLRTLRIPALLITVPWLALVAPVGLPLLVCGLVLEAVYEL